MNIIGNIGNIGALGPLQVDLDSVKSITLIGVIHGLAEVM